MELRGHQTQFYIDLIYGVGFAAGFGYLLFGGMDPLVAAFQGGLVFGYFLRVWENMSVYERILQEEVAAEAEAAVAEEAEEAVVTEAEEAVAEEVEHAVADEVTDEVEKQVAEQMSAEVQDEVEEQIDERLDAEMDERVSEEVEAQIEEHAPGRERNGEEVERSG